MKEKIDQFCKNYEIYIVDDQKRRARYHPPRYFTDPSRADIISRDFVEYETEKVFTVQIPESRFRALVEMEQRFFGHHNHGYSDADMFAMLMEKEREESWHRQSSAAVQKAYEQYSIMLNLAGFQRKI
mgnify:FL=1|jgi:hypothetical protein